MNEINEQILDKIKSDNCSFGDSLRKVRTNRNISLRQMARRVDKTSAYLSDVECDHIKPPNNRLLNRILMELSLEDICDPLRGYLYDLAASQRREAPDDIVDYLLSHEELRNIIRLAMQRNIGNDFWQKCSKEILEEH